jgi:hypothetical protein
VIAVSGQSRGFFVYVGDFGRIGQVSILSPTPKKERHSANHEDHRHPLIEA